MIRSVVGPKNGRLIQNLAVTPTFAVRRMIAMSRRSDNDVQNEGEDALDINSRTLHHYYHTVVADSDEKDPIAEALLRRGQRLAREKARRAKLRAAAIWAAGLLAVLAVAAIAWSFLDTMN